MSDPRTDQGPAPVRMITEPLTLTGDGSRALWWAVHRRLLDAALATSGGVHTSIGNAKHAADLAAAGYATAHTRRRSDGTGMVGLVITATDAARALARYVVVVIDLTTGNPTRLDGTFYGDGDGGHAEAQARAVDLTDRTHMAMAVRLVAADGAR